jgi:hypothetical protein
VTPPADKPKKLRGLAAMSPEKAAAIRAKGAFTSETARERGAKTREAGNRLRKAAPALEAALTAAYELLKAHGAPEWHSVMKNAAAALRSARGETETKE